MREKTGGFRFRYLPKIEVPPPLLPRVRARARFAVRTLREPSLLSRVHSDNECSVCRVNSLAFCVIALFARINGSFQSVGCLLLKPLRGQVSFFG